VPIGCGIGYCTFALIAIMLDSLLRGLAGDRQQRLICGERGASCALRERARGPVAVKASGSASERPPIKGCNDVAVDGFGQAWFFVLPSAFRLLYVALRAKQ
jgi:hypothetical protein